MLALSIILIILSEPKRRILTAIITIGITAAILKASLYIGPNKILMRNGQLTTSISLFFSLPLFFLIWKKNNTI